MKHIEENKITIPNLKIIREFEAFIPSKFECGTTSHLMNELSKLFGFEISEHNKKNSVQCKIKIELSSEEKEINVIKWK